MKLHEQLGFTMIELLMVIVILGIITAGSSELLVQGFRAFSVEKSYNNVSWQGRITIEKMNRDLRAIRSPTDISTATSSQISFTNVDGNVVTYCVSGTQMVRGNQLSCAGQALADGVSGLIFTYYNSDGVAFVPTMANYNLIRYVRINFSITNFGKTSKFTTLVYPWNLTV